jgi:hypothetical protein
MKGHFGAVLTSGLAAVALALALIQANVVAHGTRKREPATAVRSGPTNRFSAPGGRSGIPRWLPADKAQQEKPLPPEDPEGRSPPRRQEEHRSPPPSRFRGAPPRLGPQPARRVAA